MDSTENTSSRETGTGRSREGFHDAEKSPGGAVKGPKDTEEMFNNSEKTLQDAEKGPKDTEAARGRLDRKEFVRELARSGFLIDPELLLRLPDKAEYRRVLSCIRSCTGGPAVVCSEAIELLSKGRNDINWSEFESVRTDAIRNGAGGRLASFVDAAGAPDWPGADASEDKTHLEEQETQKSPEKKGVSVVFSYDGKAEPRTVQDFVSHYNKRFASLSAVLSSRPELSNLTSIGRLIRKKDRESVAVIGMIRDKTLLSSGNIMLNIEDRTGEIKVLASAGKKEVMEAAKSLVHDEVIGIVGVTGDRIIFANSITFPDIPAHKELKKSPDEAYAVFLSDLHIGSDNFLEAEFRKFLRWLNGEIGTEKHKDIVKKTRYLFIAGDLVDGVGIYPGQENELHIKDIKEQLALCAELLSQVPQHISIIVCPGNHEPVRLSEPQPLIEQKYAEKLYSLPNLTMVSNPGIVNIHSSGGFPGFDVLLYHGYSFDYFISEVDEIRAGGGYDRADLIMRFLLQRRHLAPSHTSTLYVADPENDNLCITRIPDFFVTGHIHKTAVSSYKNISLICGSCWQSKTKFQEKMGHNPDPAMVPIVNLQTRKTKVLRF